MRMRQRWGSTQARSANARMDAPHLRVVLLNNFRLFREGEALRLAGAGQRLLVLLSLHDGPIRRQFAAGRLWLDVPDERAAASLRSSLWRLRQAEPRLVDISGSELQLGTSVEVDYVRTRTMAMTLVDRRADPSMLESTAPEEFAFDLLPDWHEEWVVIEREQFRQLRLHALEVLCERFSAAERHGEAIRSGLMAVSGEPLRESAQRALISAFLVEGNKVEALRQYVAYRTLLRKELGVEPSARATALVRGLSPR